METPSRPFPPQLVDGTMSVSRTFFVLVLYTTILSFWSTLAFKISRRDPFSLLNRVLPIATMKSKYALSPARLPGLLGYTRKTC